MGGCDGNPTEPMDGDLGGVDIMNGEEEAIDCKSFLFFKKKKIESKERWKNGRLFTGCQKKKRKGNGDIHAGSEETKIKKVKGKCVY